MINVPEFITAFGIIEHLVPDFITALIVTGIDGDVVKPISYFKTPPSVTRFPLGGQYPTIP
jgi:hypothetical protein